MVYAAAIVLALFYGSQIPLVVALRVSTQGQPGFGVGVAAWRGDWAERQALKPRKAQKRPAASAKKAPKISAMALLRAAGDMLRRVERVRVRAQIGTGDAASTAVLCGLMRMLLAPFADARVSPSFHRACLELSGIIEIKAGNIIRAMVSAGFQERKMKFGKASD